MRNRSRQQRESSESHRTEQPLPQPHNHAHSSRIAPPLTRNSTFTPIRIYMQHTTHGEGERTDALTAAVLHSGLRDAARAVERTNLPICCPMLSVVCSLLLSPSMAVEEGVGEEGQG